MKRRRLQELSCPVKDVVSWASLDGREALAAAEAAGEVESRDPAELAAGLARGPARDPRPSLRPLQFWFFWRLQVEGLRAFAFGKVEILEAGA